MLLGKLNQVSQFCRAGFLPPNFDGQHLQVVVSGKVSPGGVKDQKPSVGDSLQGAANIGIQIIYILQKFIQIGLKLTRLFRV